MKKKIFSKNYLIKKITMGLVLSICLFSYSGMAVAFGNNLGEHCWQGDTSGVIIRHQVTQLGEYYNLNGATGFSNISGRVNPAYGTGFIDKNGTGNIKLGYTVVRSSYMDYITVYLELDPASLNGMKTVFLNSEPPYVETVTHIPCP